MLRMHFKEVVLPMNFSTNFQLAKLSPWPSAFIIASAILPLSCNRCSHGSAGCMPPVLKSVCSASGCYIWLGGGGEIYMSGCEQTDNRNTAGQNENRSIAEHSPASCLLSPFLIVSFFFSLLYFLSPHRIKVATVTRETEGACSLRLMIKVSWRSTRRQDKEGRR